MGVGNMETGAVPVAVAVNVPTPVEVVVRVGVQLFVEDGEGVIETVGEVVKLEVGVALGVIVEFWVTVGEEEVVGVGVRLTVEV